MEQNEQNLWQEMKSVYCLYAELARDLNPETGLGGKLLFAGEPTDAAIWLLRAANIAGAASIAASADAPVLRRVMREGALDFVVTDLDEAVRILKNEIRQKRPVAVGVSIAPQLIAAQMIERGVQPDLLGMGLGTDCERDTFMGRGARVIESQPLTAGSTVKLVAVPPNEPAAKFDESLLEGTAPENAFQRRWVRFAPRYLPAAARRFRLVTG